MNIKRTSLIAVAITAALTLSACSSSDDDANDPDTGSETNPDNNGTQNDPDNGGSNNNPDNGGSDNNPDNGGSNNNPDNGGSDNNPDNGGSDNNPDNGGSDNNPDNGSPTDSFDLRSVDEGILHDLAGEGLEKLYTDISAKATEAANSANSVDTLPDGTVNLAVQGTPQPFTVSRISYNCEQGGTLVVESVNSQDSSAGSSNDTTQVAYMFDQCQFGADMGDTLTGTTMFTRQTDTTFRDITNDKSYNWESFQWLQQDGTQIDVSASIDADNYNSENNEENLVVSITEFTERKDDVVVSSLQNTSLELNEESGPGYSEYSLEASGTLLDENGVTITVETNPAVFKKFVNPMSGEESIPLGGQIDFTASDGSSLQMAVRSDDDGERVADVTYTDKDGNTSVSEAEPFIEIQVFAN